MAFMEPQMTGKDDWFEVETTSGETTWVPADVVSGRVSATTLQPFVEGDVDTWKRRSAYGVRLSAPGYMDATEWEVFTNKREAEARYAELVEEQREENPKRSVNWLSPNPFASNCGCDEPERASNPADPVYEVSVGNVGTVYRGNDRADAYRVYKEYERNLKSGNAGRAEVPVTLFEFGELRAEYEGE